MSITPSVSMHSSRVARRVLMGAAALGALATVASAETATPASADSSTKIGEVVVVARHRLESLQSVPIAISVVDGAQAASKNLNDVQDISAQVPVVDFRTSASNKDQTIFIRGVGTISTSPGVEPSVSTVIDGVVIARAGAATLDLLDLDHIEVLRGPQGTLFGKNASAGVINIVTKAPSSTPGGYLDAAGYTGGEYRVSGGVTGPIVANKLKGLLTAFVAAFDGNVNNVTLGQKVNGYQNEGLKAKFVATPSGALTLTLAADYTHSFEDIPTGVWATTSRVAYPTGAVSSFPAFATQMAAEGVTPSADNTKIAADVRSRASDDNGGVSLQADWELGGGYLVTSITAYRDWQNVQHQDYDQMAVATSTYPGIQDIGHLSFHQVSEELRLASPKGRLVDYVVGAYVLDGVDHETYERDVTMIGGATPGLNSGVGHYGSKDINYALFGEANVNLTPGFRVIGGGRVIWDDLSFYNTRVSTQPAAITAVQPSFSANGSETKNGFAGRAGLQYDIAPHVMAYATYSHGYKGPAYNVFFNQTATVTAPLNPETSNAYEIGFKGRFLDQKIQADVTAFRTDFSNYQANSTFLVAGALVTNLVNAGSVRTQGFEGDFTAKPIHGLTLDLNLIYDDAKVVNFPCPTGAAASCNINGGHLPFAPEFKSHLQGDYRAPLSSKFDVDLETDFNWQSSTQYQLSQIPQGIQGAYGIWNASVGLFEDKAGLSARVLVKNIADQHYSSYLAPGNEGSTGIVRWVPRDNSRYVGVDVRKTF